MKGRKPIPAKVKLLRGNPSRQVIRPEAEPSGPIPRCPKHLSKAAKAKWAQKVPVLAGCGLLTAADADILAIYCQAWGRWVEAEEKLAGQDLIIASPNGYPIQNPWLAISKASQAEIRSCAAEFGMTPSSRTRIGATAPAPADPLEKFLPIRKHA